jgi:hypothetical protein
VDYGEKLMAVDNNIDAQKAYDAAYDAALAAGKSTKDATAAAEAARTKVLASATATPGDTPPPGTEEPSIREKFGIGEALLKSEKWAGKLGDGQLADVFDLWKKKKYTAAEDLFYKTKFSKLSDSAKKRNLLMLEESDEYKNGLKSFVDKMRGILLQNNLPVDTTKLEEYYLNGIGEDIILTEVYNASTSGGVTGGPNDKNLNLLKKAAKNNNIDLNTEFGGEIDSWLKNIFNGQSIDVYYQKIRDAAAGNVDNEYVKGLLADGQNLRNIYDRYITLMATKFKISADAINLNDPLLSQVFKDSGKTGTGMNLTQFENLLNNDSRYKAGLGEFSVKNTRQAIVDYALTEGFQLNDEAIEDLLNNILAMGLPAESPYVRSLIRAKFTYSPGVTLGGVSGNRLNALRQTAARNGFKLEDQFGTQIEGWLKRLSQGEDIETFNSVIRQAAGFGRPKEIQSLLGLGVDLDTIASPYKNTIATELGINPQTISANDDLLNQALMGETQPNMRSFRQLVRKDPRFAEGSKGYEEIYNAGLMILKDFGFQG